MKTKKTHLIILFLCLYFQPFYGQDTLSTRIATSYEAETYYLYNKESSKGRLGSLTANRDGITTYSNNFPIRFAFKDDHNYFVNITNYNDDALIYSDRNYWFRIGSNSGLAFWGDGNYKSSNPIPNLKIDARGYVGINIDGATERLHLKNGNAIVENGSLYLSRTTGVPARFNLQWEANGYKLGTASSGHYTVLGTNTGSNLTLYDEGYAVFRRDYSSFPAISLANKYKYSVFALGGILSEDYAIGPKSSWADYVFDKNYELKPLSQVEAFINEHNRLPDIPSAEQIGREGYDLHEMNVKLLEKVEELTLHVIRLEKEMQSLKTKQASE